MVSNLVLLDVCCVFLAVFLAKRWMSASRGRQPFPPGPKPLPLLGNLLDVPTTHQWKTFTEWNYRWGDVSSVTVLGQRVVVLNSVQAAVDLLEKRSSIFSDRPILTMAGELMAWGETLVFSPYGDRFRDIRRYLHRYIGSRGQLEKMAPFHDLQEAETHQFLVRLLRDPEPFIDHIRKTAGTIILKLGYGYQTKDGGDPLVELVDRAVVGFTVASSPGAFLVDTIPLLKWIPEWFPGTAWKQKAKEWRAETIAMCDVPFEIAKEAAVEGTGDNNFVADNLGNATDPLQEYHLKMAAGSLYSGGADTTVSAITTFFLAMARNPEVQRRAQREIDTVVGSDRLPAIADRDNLPYTRALVSEVFRWHPIAPLGVPHRSIKDDIYREWLIPKDSIIIPNIWHMLRDPDVYCDPSEFKPERFLGENGKEPEQDPRCAVFGFGRRICPGLNLAELSVFISCAMTLAVFDIGKLIENGAEITPEVAYSTGTISHPLPFKCSIKPRSEKARSLILGS